MAVSTYWLSVTCSVKPESNVDMLGHYFRHRVQASTDGVLRWEKVGIPDHCGKTHGEFSSAAEFGGIFSEYYQDKGPVL